jgi:hypothetical protein
LVTNVTAKDACAEVPDSQRQAGKNRGRRRSKASRDISRSSETVASQAITQRRLRKPRFVCSSYLVEELRPHFADYDPTRYVELFDEADIMSSLIVADRMSQHHPFVEPWLGLFVDDAANAARLADSRYGAVLAELGGRVSSGRPCRPGCSAYRSNGSRPPRSVLPNTPSRCAAGGRTETTTREKPCAPGSLPRPG